MNGQRVCPAAFFVSVFLWSCATATSSLNVHLHDQDVDLRKFLRDHPIAEGKDVRVDLLASGPTTSAHVVQLRKAEKPHIHAAHDLRVVIIRGRGTMVIARKKIAAGVGSVFEISRGTPHYFVNEGPVPGAAFVTFTPPYDGKDMIPVPGD